jgi:hypothetical protein
MDSKFEFIFSRTSTIVELLTILQPFNKLKFQNISGTRAANWQYNLAADLS